MNLVVPSRKKKGGSAAPASTPISRVTILLEDIQGKVQATMEAVTATRNQLRGESQELRVELSRRIDVLALAVRQNSDDIRQNSEGIRELKADVRQTSEDIRELKADVQQLKADVRQNTEAIHRSAEEIRTMRELLERKADHETLLRLQARVEVVERRLGIQ